MRMITAQEHDDLLAAKEKCDAFAAQLDRMKVLDEDATLEQRDAEMRAQGAESVVERFKAKEAWATRNGLLENAKLYRRCANVAKHKADDHRCGRDA